MLFWEMGYVIMMQYNVLYRLLTIHLYEILSNIFSWRILDILQEGFIFLQILYPPTKFHIISLI